MDHDAGAARWRSAVAVLSVSMALLGTACGGPEGVPDAGSVSDNSFWYAGYVYDGVTGRRLVDYRIDMKYLDRSIRGTVDPDGRYLLGPLVAQNDYSVIVSADGYRPFESHNPMVAPAAAESFLYDAYLYPIGLLAPAARIEVRSTDVEELPSGRIRLRPVSGSNLFAAGVDTPAAVGSQRWGNDADLQLDTVFKSFTGGVAEIAPGELVYGVQYSVRVFEVDGHQDGVTQLLAGSNALVSVDLAPWTDDRLRIVFDTTQLRQPQSDGAVTFVFNREVAFDPYFDTAPLNVSAINTVDEDEDGEGNTLADRTQVRISIDGTTLGLAWDPESSLETADADDRIFSLTYGGLNNVHLIPAGGDARDATTLDNLRGGARTVTVQMVPFP